MTHKILVAVDESEASEHAFEYAVRVARDLKNSRLTLFHVGPAIPAEILEYDKLPGEGSWEEKLEEHRMAVDDYERRERIDEEGHFTQLRSRARKLGIADTQIDADVCADMNGISNEILLKAQQGGYEAICLGRNQRGALKGLITAHITDEVLRRAGGRAVWIIE